jgi:hypothetical protein
MIVKVGQVWIEDVITKHGDSWQQLHFVTDVKEYYSAGNKDFMVCSNTANKKCINTLLSTFKQFTPTKYIVNVLIPYIEQYTLDDLELISQGVRLHQPNPKSLDLALSLTESLDDIKKVAGSNHYWEVVRVIKILADVAAATGVNSKVIHQELWLKGIN